MKLMRRGDGKDDITHVNVAALVVSLKLCGQTPSHCQSHLVHKDGVEHGGQRLNEGDSFYIWTVRPLERR